MVLALLVVGGSAATVVAEGANNRSVTALDQETFITVKDTVRGEIVSLYKVRGDRLILVDVVVSSASREHKAEKRYLHREDVDNR
jgi:hypothetical protein